MSEKKKKELGSGTTIAQSSDIEIEKSFEDIFDREEIRAIQEEINQKFQSDSDVSHELDDRIHNTVPQKRAQRIPLSVSIPSIILLVFSAVLLFEPASSSEATVFSLLFPSVARDAVSPEDVNLTQVTRIIPDAQSQQRFGVILGKISQERALDYFTEVKEIAIEQNVAITDEPEALETQIEAIEEAITQATEEIATFQESDEESESDTAVDSAPVPTLVNFEALRAEQEQYEGLVSQYTALTDRVRSAVVGGDLNLIETRISNLQAYIDALSASDSSSIELIVESGNRYILTVQEVLVALRTASAQEQQQGSATQEYISILEDAQQQYLQLNRQVRNAIASGNTNALERSIEALGTYIGTLSADDGQGIASLISSGENLIENGQQYLEQINQLSDLNGQIATLEGDLQLVQDDLQQAQEDLASFQTTQQGQDAINAANFQSQEQQIIALNQQVSSLNDEIATLQEDLRQSRQNLATLQSTQQGQNAVSSANLQSQNQQISRLNEQISLLQSQVASLTNQSRTYQVSGRLCEDDLIACKRSVTQ